jgi:hypothetical protein
LGEGGGEPLSARCRDDLQQAQLPTVDRLLFRAPEIGSDEELLQRRLLVAEGGKDMGIGIDLVDLLGARLRVRGEEVFDDDSVALYNVVLPGLFFIVEIILHRCQYSGEDSKAQINISLGNRLRFRVVSDSIPQLFALIEPVLNLSPHPHIVEAANRRRHVRLYDRLQFLHQSDFRLDPLIFWLPLIEFLTLRFNEAVKCRKI